MNIVYVEAAEIIITRSEGPLRVPGGWRAVPLLYVVRTYSLDHITPEMLWVSVSEGGAGHRRFVGRFGEGQSSICTRVGDRLHVVS